jgi:SWI/SNF-related matrix-associated actin-dependent regulator 1 of chromatin subfamily A
MKRAYWQTKHKKVAKKCMVFQLCGDRVHVKRSHRSDLDRHLGGVFFKNRHATLTLLQYKRLASLWAAEERVELVPERVWKLAFKVHAPEPVQWERLSKRIRDALFPFQKEGVEKCLQFGTRALLADEMGLGKTLQAIAVMSYCRELWPLLVVCPSYLRLNWAREFQQWMPGVKTYVVKKSKDALKEEVGEAEVVIVSYDLMPRLQWKRKFQCLICDESHYIKNKKAKRTKALVPLAQKAKRVLLLSGTPLSNRPVEAFTQVQCLRPKYFGNYGQFVRRYCGAKYDIFGFNVSGASNVEELGFLLRRTLMVRRLKRNVLTQLPQKMRSEVPVEVPPKMLREASKGLARLKEIGRAMGVAQEGSTEANKLIFEQKKLISELFRANAVAKQGVAAELLLATLEQVESVVVFAKHMCMLDFLQDKLQCTHMRIDGSVSQDAREKHVQAFQEGKCRVALLSIGAASTGITLTRASCMLFVELDWNPATLRQAEDRIHRIGQSKACDIRYVIATGTIDEMIYRKITYKAEVIGRVLGDL